MTPRLSEGSKKLGMSVEVRGSRSLSRSRTSISREDSESDSRSDGAEAGRLCEGGDLGKEGLDWALAVRRCDVVLQILLPLAWTPCRGGL